MKVRITRADGFTLLELLVAITLLAVVVVVIVQAMRLGMRAIESGDRKIAGLERTRALLSVIEPQLQSAFMITASRDAQAGEQPVQFRGESGAVEFRSYQSLWGGAKGPVAVSYRVVDDEPGFKALRVSESPLAIDAANETLVIGHAQEIFFEFYYRTSTDETGQWVDQWKEPERLPSKVRLTVRQDQRTLSVIAPLRAAGSVVQMVTSPVRTPK